MKAALRDRYGPPDVVYLGEVDRPVPSDLEILVRVHAASVNRADLDGIRPRPAFTRLFLGLRAPRVRRVGCDVAGVVESVGAGVSRFRPGDRVFADLYAFGQGSLAEYVSAPERAFAPLPEGISFETAATLPHAAILAVQGLRLRNGRTIKAGDRVLVDGASGNVGPFAVQIARSRGAEVTGVCSTGKMDLVRSLGADHVLDYTQVDYTKTGERYDWILDTDGHHGLLANRRALQPDGVYVTLGGTAVTLLQILFVGSLVGRFSRRWMGLMYWWKPFRAEDVATLTDMLAAGTLTPVIDRRFPLSEVVDALRWVDEGHARGKVLVIP